MRGFEKDLARDPAGSRAARDTAVSRTPWARAAVRRLAGPAALLGSAIAGGVLVPAAGRLGGPRAEAALDGVLTAVVWFAGAWLAARVVDGALSRFGRGDGGERAPKMLGDLARALLFGLAAVGVVSSLFGEPVAGLLATSGVLIAVLGFALRGIIADVFSGIALGAERAYRIGDWIEAPTGVVGRVAEINWRATRLVTRDGVTAILPNGMLAGGRVLNYSRPGPGYRASVRVALDAAVPVPRARRLLLSAALRAGDILREPRPDVVVEGMGERGVSYVVRFWVKDCGVEIACRDAVLEAVAGELARARVETSAPRLRLDRQRPGPDPAEGEGARDLLAGIELFSAFEPAEIDGIAAWMRRRLVPQGTDVVRQGEPGSSLFVLGEGALDVLWRSSSGAAVPIDRLGPGDVFGEMSLLTGEARSATVRAATEALVYEIDKAHVEPLLRARPQIAERLATLMAARRVRNSAYVEAQAASAPAEPRAAPDILDKLMAFFRLGA